VGVSLAGKAASGTRKALRSGRMIGVDSWKRCTLVFATSSGRHRTSLLASQVFSVAVPGQGRRHDHETTVDHALIRGLAGPVMRRGASSVQFPASGKILLIVPSRVLLAVTVPPPLSRFRCDTQVEQSCDLRRHTLPRHLNPQHAVTVLIACRPRMEQGCSDDWRAIDLCSNL
jgi:hypothetical protein